MFNIFSASTKRSSSNNSYNSTISQITEADEYRSALGSIKSFLYSSIFGDNNGSTSWGSAESNLSSKQYSVTEETWLTPTEDTITTVIDMFENHSLMVDSETLLPIGSDTMSSSSSLHSVSQFNKRQYEKSQMKIEKNKSKMKWFEKLTSKIGVVGSTESTPIRIEYERLSRYDSRPVPKHLLEHKGPECPFVVRTKDFQLYSKFSLEKIPDDDS